MNDINRVRARIEAAEVVEADRLDDVLRTLGGRWPLILGVSLLCGVIMGGVSLWLTPIYRGSAVLAAAHSDKNGMSSSLGESLGGSVSGFAALAGLGLGTDDSATNEAIAVLRSEQLTEEFIKQNNLMPELFPRQWDRASGDWKKGLKKIPTLGRASRTFEKIRHIEQDAKTGLITLQIDWKDRIKAADWTNRLVMLLNDEMRNRAIAESEASLGYLQKEYGENVDVSTHEAISKLIESQVKKKMLAHVTQEYALRVIDRAIVPDKDFPVRPNKILLVALGTLFGGLLAVAVILVKHRRRLDARPAVQRTAADLSVK